MYRAVDQQGHTIDFYLSAKRNANAAKLFLAKAFGGLHSWQMPRTLNTDKSPTYPVAIALLKAQGTCPVDIQHRQVKYLNNLIECDHGKLKRIIKPMLGFKSMHTAYTTIKGIEALRALRKRLASFSLWPSACSLGEVCLVNRAFSF